jgi:hypothetical protein
MRAAAAVTLVVIGLSTARAAEPGTLTLACTGTTTSPDETLPISMGIIVNFTAQTVLGFDPPGSDAFPVKIDANDVTIFFSGKQLGVGIDRYIMGRIDRVTGDVKAVSTMSFKHDKYATDYALKCRPAQRLF